MIGTDRGDSPYSSMTNPRPKGGTPASQPMPNAYDSEASSEATLKSWCVTHCVVGLSTLASMAVLLVQVVPPLMYGFP